MTEHEFQDVLKRPESETLDFKATGYDLKNIEKRTDLVKDVLAMANTPIEDVESCLVLGVKRNRDGSTEYPGPRHFEDDADLQCQFSERVTPVPTFAYRTAGLFGKQSGVIAISRDLRGPFMLSKNFGTTSGTLHRASGSGSMPPLTRSAAWRCSWQSRIDTRRGNCPVRYSRPC